MPSEEAGRLPAEEAFDWNAAWKERQLRRRHDDSLEFWNGKAPSFAKTAGTSPYARDFMERADVQPGDTVLDMGCGSGTLALPYARNGIEVWAADFSPVMLELMMKRAVEEGLGDLVHPIRLSWNDDWDAADTVVPVCDIAIASRSMAADDLQDALVKLSSRARKRVCVTLGTDSSPRTDEVLLRAVGRPVERFSDYVFGMNILWALGYQPSLSYIRSQRSSCFESPEEAVSKTAMLMEATPEERARLEQYAAEHLVTDVDKYGAPCWRFDHTRVTSWAFISWDTAH